MSSTLLIPVLLILLVGFMFFGTRKQKRAVAQQQDMQKSLSYGDRVMTTSGLYATVVETSDDTIDLEIAPGFTTTWLRAAVREKVADTPELADEDVESIDDEVTDYEEIDGDEAETAEVTDEVEGADEEHEAADSDTESDSSAAAAKLLEQSSKTSS
ncbi:MAG TPA: preprotein translocase subunit YajC [Pseudonocardiaceae bacterium]|jgi:preprotein translocase subunit YajC|nr:preprotein translocase subunit YajC [Pseudonocardiaceae bacterium]